MKIGNGDVANDVDVALCCCSSLLLWLFVADALCGCCSLKLLLSEAVARCGCRSLWLSMLMLILEIGDDVGREGVLPFTGFSTGDFDGVC